MKRNKHLLLWSSVGTILLLGWAAYQEHFGQEWRGLQREYQLRLPADRAADFSIRLRQVVVPALKVTDRCVSCHVGMAPGEAAIVGDRRFGAHPSVVHDPAGYGCTVCHGGQGSATKKADAHGAVRHWPEPMIPEPYRYAGCGSCHTHLAVPNRAQLEQGRNLFERYDCLNCHSVDGRGGTLRTAGAATIPGPDLSLAASLKDRSEWYEHHLRQASTNGEQSWKDTFRKISEADLEAIQAYLSSRVGAPGLIESKAVFQSLGCRGCHTLGGVGGDDGPELDNVGKKDPGQLDFSRVRGAPTTANWMAEHFRAPAALVPGSLMPAMGLSEEEITQLTFYMLSLRKATFPGEYWPEDRIRAAHLGEREFASDGATLYGTFCASCHGSTGQGMRYPRMTPFPSIGNKDFLELATDEFITQTVIRGRPGRRMPAWGEKSGGLKPDEIRAVVAHVRGFGVGRAPAAERQMRWVQSDAAAGGRLYSENCARCHGEDGIGGGEGTALNNSVLLETASDTYLMETMRRGREGTTMPAFGTASTTHRMLSSSDMESIVAFIRTWEVKQ